VPGVGAATAATYALQTQFSASQASAVQAQGGAGPEPFLPEGSNQRSAELATGDPGPAKRCGKLSDLSAEQKAAIRRFGTLVNNDDAGKTALLLHDTMNDTTEMHFGMTTGRKGDRLQFGINVTKIAGMNY